MFPLVGHTAGPNGLNFLWTLKWSLGGHRLKNRSFFFKFLFFYLYICLFFQGQRRALRSYMSALADQTSIPNRLKFFKGTHGYPGGNKG